MLGPKHWLPERSGTACVSCSVLGSLRSLPFEQPGAEGPVVEPPHAHPSPCSADFGKWTEAEPEEKQVVSPSRGRADAGPPPKVLTSAHSRPASIYGAPSVCTALARRLLRQKDGRPTFPNRRPT